MKHLGIIKIKRFTAKNRVERINDEIERNLVLDSCPMNSKAYFFPVFRELNKEKWIDNDFRYCH